MASQQPSNNITRSDALQVIKESYDNVITILKDESYNDPVYNLSIYKNVFITLNESLKKETTTNAGTEVEVEKINYKELKTSYFVLYALYKQLYDKIIEFKKRYFDSDNQLRKLNEQTETSLISEMKSKADEIIEYGILFNYIDNFLVLTKFIYNFEAYYESFKDDRKIIKKIFRALINTTFKDKFTIDGYKQYIMLLYFYTNFILTNIYKSKPFEKNDLIELERTDYEVAININEIKKENDNDNDNIESIQIGHDGQMLYVKDIVNYSVQSPINISDDKNVYKFLKEKISALPDYDAKNLNEIFDKDNFTDKIMDLFRNAVNDKKNSKALQRGVKNLYKRIGNINPMKNTVQGNNEIFNYFYDGLKNIPEYISKKTPATQKYFKEKFKLMNEIYKDAFHKVSLNQTEFNEINDILAKLIAFKPNYDNIIVKEGTDIQSDANFIDAVKMKPDEDVADFLSKNGLKETLTGALDKLDKNKPISVKDLHEFNNIEDSIKQLEDGEEKDKALAYIYQVKDKLNKQNKNFKDEDIIDTTKIILNFTNIANIFRKILLGLTMICLVLYVVVLIISIYNFINLLLRIIISIVYLYFNTIITNEDTLSYSTQRIINCTKDNYTDDIFNVLNEQLTALSVFNTIIYIFYLLLGYIIVYILFFVYASSLPKTHLLYGDIKDIDPRFTLLTVIGLIFICSFIHLLIYRFLFKSVCINKYKDLNKSEKSIDELISNEFSNKTQDTELNAQFYKLLEDTSKRNEIDTFFNNMVLDMQNSDNSNLGQFLLIYDIYIYFEDYLYLNDIKKVEIKKYFDRLIKSKTNGGDTKDDKKPGKTFVSFLDTNERRLIKPYHEELPFYNQIPSEKLDYFKVINENIGDILKNINKSIIKYSGTFYPFLFTTIYIILICFYNLLCVYIIFAYIADTKKENIFFEAMYNFVDKILYIYNTIYNIINN